MHRLVKRFRATIRHRRPKAGRWQHPQRSGQHRGTIGQDITEQVVGQDHVKLLGRTHQLHRAIIGIHMAQLDIGILSQMHFRDHVAPQNAAFHHIGLLHGADLVATPTRKLKGSASDAGNFGFGIALGVDANALVTLFVDAARLAEIDP